MDSEQKPTQGYSMAGDWGLFTIAVAISLMAALVLVTATEDPAVAASTQSYDMQSAICRFIGAFAGLMMLTYVLAIPVGWLTYYLARKDIRAARMGFALVALCVGTVLALGTYRIRRVEAQGIASSLPQPTNGVHSRFDSSDAIDPAATTGISSADKAILLEFVRNFAADCDKQNQDYQRDVANLVGNGILQPSELDTADKIATARAKMAQAGSLVEDYRENRAAILEGCAARIASLPVPSKEKAALLQEYRTNVETERGQIEQIAETDESFVEEAGRLLDFLDSRVGAFTVNGEQIYFNDDADVSRYNAFKDRLNELIANEQQLTQKSQQLSQQWLSDAEQVCDTQ